MKRAVPNDDAISVVVTTFNRGARIAATLDSVLAQTVAPCEILVIDDGSSDDTAAWIEKHYAQHANLRVIGQENAGVAAARNRGLREVRGELVAFLDHDDIWHPQKLQRQLDALQSAPQAALCWCLWREIEAAMATSAPLVNVCSTNRSGEGAAGAFSMISFPKTCLISASVPLIRTAFLRQIGGFDARTQPADDWDCWLCLARRYPGGVFERNLAGLRVARGKSIARRRIDVARLTAGVD